MGQVKNKKLATPTPPKDDFKRPVMLNTLPKKLPPANKKTTGSAAQKRMSVLAAAKKRAAVKSGNSMKSVKK
jgi:hypothetical protein